MQFHPPRESYSTQEFRVIEESPVELMTDSKLRETGVVGAGLRGAEEAD